MLPVQTKRTFFTVVRTRITFARQAKTELFQVNPSGLLAPD